MNAGDSSASTSGSIPPSPSSTQFDDVGDSTIGNIGRPTPCPPRDHPPGPSSGAREGKPAKRGRDIAVPVRAGMGGRGFLYRVDTRRVSYQEDRSTGGLLLITGFLEERRVYLGCLPLWVRAGEVVSRLQDPLDVVVRAFLRTGHVPADPLV